MVFRRDSSETDMQPKEPHAEFVAPKRPLDPFRRAVVRGLAILLPPLLTIAIFLWVGNTVRTYLLEPMEVHARRVLVNYVADIRTGSEIDAVPNAKGIVAVGDIKYKEIDQGRFVPLAVYNEVNENLGTEPMPATAKGVYTRYYNQTLLQPQVVIPVFLCLFILALYLLGKFLAAGVGRFFWNQLERVIHRVPLVRNVYSSVKQVTDFLFTDPDLEYTRVVAVEYPRKGIWTVAFVTGEGMNDVRTAAGEPILSVLIPTSPMPFTGFTVTVKKSETVDLDITVDQAFQFVISCGVVVPPHQLADAIAKQADRQKPSLALSATSSRDE
jgi:uncharacterized membrane protein